MKLNEDFRTRQDVDGWMVCFRDEGVLEMSLIGVIITELLRGEKTREQLIVWVLALFPDVDAETEVDEMLQIYKNLELLNNS